MLTIAPTVEGTLPWLSLLIALPSVIAAVLLFVKPLRVAARPIALIASLVVLAGVIAAVVVDWDPVRGPAYQLGETVSWVPAIGLSWALGVNGMGLTMIILAAALTPLVLLASWNDDKTADRQAGYVGLILFLETFMILIFSARDVLLFYLAFEGMLIPLYFLIGRFGGDGRRKASIKFLLYSLLGGLVMLFGVVALYVAGPGGPTAFLMETLTEGGTAPELGAWQMPIFLTFFFAFAVKAPMVPVHTWLPDTAAAARPGTSVLLVGVLDKVGTFGMIAFCVTLFPQATKASAVWIVWAAVVSILWGALAALAQKDLLRLVSFTSISHFGFMVLGIYIGSETALSGAMLYMVAHGVSIAGLFLLSGWVTQRAGTAQIAKLGGLQRVTPVLAGLFLVSGLAAIALPGLSGFVPEYMVLVGTFKTDGEIVAMFAVLGVVLAALYILIPYQKIFTGPKVAGIDELPDLGVREKLVMAPLVLAMFALGFFPGVVLDLVNPVSENVLDKADARNWHVVDETQAQGPAWDVQAAIEGGIQR
ncbi:MAG: NADH-quinone oxidoreductase subunit M [Actinomycetaceae bacterium]|nr:NADH-quinone oxidoreductase subunit M [Actinomycetaceae bacterium]